MFIRSGIRFDYMMKDQSGGVFRRIGEISRLGAAQGGSGTLCQRRAGRDGQTPCGGHEKFRQKYERLNQKYGKEQYLVPYLMSLPPRLHPGRRGAPGRMAEQVGPSAGAGQDFYPTPAPFPPACIHRAGPRTMAAVCVPTDAHDKAMQRALMQWKRPEKRPLVLEALRRTHRGTDRLWPGVPSAANRPAAGSAPGGGPGPPESRTKAQAEGKRVEHNDVQPSGRQDGPSRRPGKNAKREGAAVKIPAGRNLFRRQGVKTAKRGDRGDPWNCAII